MGLLMQVLSSFCSSATAIPSERPLFPHRCPGSPSRPMTSSPRQIHARRHLLRKSALEIFFADRTSALFDFSPPPPPVPPAPSPTRHDGAAKSGPAAVAGPEAAQAAASAPAGPTPEAARTIALKAILAMKPPLLLDPASLHYTSNQSAGLSLGGAGGALYAAVTGGGNLASMVRADTRVRFRLAGFRA